MLRVEKPEWHVPLCNPDYGLIQQVILTNPTNGKSYVYWTWAESRGEIVVVVNEKQEIGFVLSERHAVLNPELYADDWEGPIDIFDYPEEQRGMTILELPRGITKTLGQEAEEELGYKITEPVAIGHLNGGTAAFVTSPLVVVARALPIVSDLDVGPHEQITGVHWVPASRTRYIETLDAFTHGALHLFRAWALRQKDPFWRDIGERL